MEEDTSCFVLASSCICLGTRIYKFTFILTKHAHKGEAEALPERNCLSLASQYLSLGFLVNILGTLLMAVTAMQVCSRFFRPKGRLSPSPRSHFTEGNTGSNLAHWILGMVKPHLSVCTWLPDSTHFEE